MSMHTIPALNPKPYLLIEVAEEDCVMEELLEKLVSCCCRLQPLAPCVHARCHS